MQSPGRTKSQRADNTGSIIRFFVPVLALLLVACGPSANIPSAGPRAVAWIDAYINAIQSGIDEDDAIEFANRYSRTKQAGETK